MSNFAWRESVTIPRRTFLASSVAASALALLPKGLSAAQEIVATTYPGAWEEAQRALLVPAVEEKTGATVILTPLLGVDQVAKITATRENPPYDVVTFDEGPFLASLHHDIVQKFPVESSAHFAELLPAFQSEWGPVIGGQPIGIAYNSEVITTPPTSWNDLWKPEYHGRVGLTGMQSSLGTAFVVEIAKLHGGSEANIEPAFAALEELLPNIGTLAQSPGALATLFQQGEIIIAPNYFQNIQALQERGVPVAFALPESGSPFIRTSLHIVKNTKVPELALSFIDTALSADMQQKLMMPPYNFIPTNRNVKIDGEIARQLFGSFEEFEERFIFPDWNRINEQRAGWIERFNKEVQL